MASRPANYRMDYSTDPPRRLTEQEVKDRITSMARKARRASEVGDNILAAALHETIDNELEDLA